MKKIVSLLILLLTSLSIITFCSSNNDEDQLTQVEDYNASTHDKIAQTLQKATIHRTKTELADYNKTDANVTRYPVISRTNAIQRLPQLQNSSNN